MGAVVAVLILLLLNMSFGSTRAAILVMVNLPLALIGGIVAIFLTESDHVLSNAAALVGLTAAGSDSTAALPKGTVTSAQS